MNHRYGQIRRRNGPGPGPGPGPGEEWRPARRVPLGYRQRATALNRILLAVCLINGVIMVCTLQSDPDLVVRVWNWVVANRRSPTLVTQSFDSVHLNRFRAWPLVAFARNGLLGAQTPSGVAAEAEFPSQRFLISMPDPEHPGSLSLNTGDSGSVVLLVHHQQYFLAGTAHSIVVPPARPRAEYLQRLIFPASIRGASPQHGGSARPSRPR